MSAERKQTGTTAPPQAQTPLQTPLQTQSPSQPQSQPQAQEETGAHMEALKKLRILVRSAARHSAWIEKQCGVSGAQLWIMQELQDEPGLRVGEVARRLSVHQTTMSNLVESLVKKGLVLRERAEHDLRVVHLSLTPQGRALLASAPQPGRGLLPEALRKLDDKHLEALNHGLDGLLEVIGTNSGAMEPMPFML